MSKDLLDFRLAYLQFIARTWRDSDYFDNVIKRYEIVDSHSDEATTTPLLNLKNILEDDEAYNYRCPWLADVFLKVDRDAVIWKPDDTGGWIGPDDAFHISIPVWDNEKNKVDEGQKVSALAAYYAQFPTFLGSGRPDPNPNVETKKNKETSKEKSTDVFSSGYSPIRPSMNAGSLGDDFLTFGSIVMRTIALAWKNKAFREELFSDSESSSINKSEVLSKYFGYTNPWNFRLVFRKLTIIKGSDREPGKNECVWVPGENDSLGRWEGLPPNRVQLYYPVKPRNEGEMPIALNTYNCTGPAYPFTCM